MSKERSQVKRLGGLRGRSGARRALSVAITLAMLLCLLPQGVALAAGDYTVVGSGDPLFGDEGDLTVRFTIRDEDGNEIKTFCGEYGKKPAMEGMVYESEGMAPLTAALAFALAHESFGAKVTDAEFSAMFGTDLVGTRRLNMMHNVVWHFMGSGHPQSGANFDAIVAGIEAMVRAYGNRASAVGDAVTSLEMDYDAAAGTLSFGRSGYVHGGGGATLTWSGDTAGLTVTAAGARLASGATVSFGDTVLVEYDGYGRVDFALTDSSRSLLIGSLTGEVFAPTTVPDGADISELDTYQKIVTGMAAFGAAVGRMALINERPVGDLTVRKALAGSIDDWGVGDGTVYKARVRDVTTGEYFTLSGTAPNYAYTGTSPTGSELSISVSQPAVIKGIPAGTVCAVEEIITANANYTTFYSGNDVTVVQDGDHAVTVTNTYDHGYGELVVSKELAGNYAGWGVDGSTYFFFRVKDATNGTYLRFSGQGPNYECVGNSGSDDPATGDLIRVSAGQPVTVSGLWAGVRYEVEEIGGPNYTVRYRGNGAMFTEGQNTAVTIVNTYGRGTGDLVISKRLAGSFADWGVGDSTEFSVRVKDATNGTYLLFSGTGPTYECIGNSGSGDPATGDVIKVSAGQPVSIRNLWSDVRYVVEEIGGANHSISYQGNNVLFYDGQNVNVTITNTYAHGTGDLIIDKVLAGSHADWGVDESTVFYVRVKDRTNGNYLLFAAAPGADGRYACVGNDVDGITEGYAGATATWLPVRAGRPLAITNLWVGAWYEVEEQGTPHCEVTYIGNGGIYAEGQNSRVTVVNDYEHGTGALVITKRLAGSHAGWKVDEATEFKVRVRDVTGGNYLLFKAEPEADGSYRCIGNDVDGLAESYGGEPISELTVTAGKPLVITNLWANLVYMVEEAGGEGYVVEYAGNGLAFQDGQNSTVAVTNTYSPDYPRDPGEPGEPDEPVEPDDPEIPYTYDARDTTLAAALLALGLGLIVAGEWLRRRKFKADIM
ncbi:MAG: DUF5979 domain-containing protein [Oscillospiraceae bacterium]|nr:DUF5979 domain-containing protein [Oscillospiraceae bacterium]